MTRYNIPTIKQAAAGRWPEIYAALASLDPRQFDGNHHPCPKCGGTDRFRMIDANAGACICNQCLTTRNGDGLAVLQWLTGDAFGQCLAKVAEHLGIAPDRKKEKDADPNEHLEFMPWSPVLAMLWCNKKQPIKPEAIQAIGGQFAKYRGQYHVIAIPVLGPSLHQGEPVGYVLYRTDGGMFPLRKGETEGVKVKLAAGSKKGIICSTTTFTNSETQLWKTEGPTDLMALLSSSPDAAGFTTGSGTAENPIDWVLKLCEGHPVNVIHDADKPGQQGATEKWCPRLAAYSPEVRNVTLPFSVERNHGPDLRDFFNGGGTFEFLLERREETAPWNQDAQKDGDRRCVIRWTDNEKEVVETIVEALTGCNDIYQRGGELLDVTESRHPLNPDASVLRVRRLPLAHQRTLITSCARFVTSTDDGELRPKRLPESITKQVDAYGKYKGIRELEAVSEYPFMRPDGSICSTSGYDAATRTFLKTNVSIEVPESPSIGDATAAANRILDLVSDFEFKDLHHQSAWFAGLLTVFCKPAVRGCVPLFIFEASMQGAGKTRLVDVISTIATGKSLARNPWPSKDEEIAKSITAIVMSGIPLVLFDNCKTQIGGQAIEALGTAEVWKSRILGVSKETGEVPIRQVYFLTGNNCSVTLDVARRTCFVRLEPTTEHPDNRSDFKIADLLGHVAENRESLIGDVLTILRAFKASSDIPEMPKCGGFENWSALVRGAIIWLGLPDPIAGTLETKEAAQANDVFGDLLDALENAGVSESLSKEICEMAKKADPYGRLFNPELNDVLMSQAGDKKLTPQRVGWILQRYDGRILGNKKFFSSMDKKLNQKKWSIQAMG